jgi:predicted permease
VTVKHALVVFQVALSVLLLSCAGVFLQMRAAARSSHVGYAVDGIALLQTDARYAGYAASTAPAVCETLRQRVAALPGVESVALSRELPMQTAGARVVVDGPGSAAEPLGTAGAIWAGAGYFEALRIPLVHGRVFDARDRADTPRVAVINERLARRYFGTVDAIGRRFRADRDADGWYEVIGVVRDTGTADRNGDLVDPTPYLFYRSFTQAGLLPTTLIARTSLDAGRLVGEMQREMRSVDATLPVLAATTMSRYLDESLQVPAAIAMFLGALAALGLGLAGLGVYAVVALSVSQRSREIGIRMALGAGAAQVIWGVGRGAAVLVGSGTGLGLVLSLLVTLGLRAAATPAPGVSLYRPAVDVAAVLLIAILMVVLGIAAACVPAARASTLDPITALRRD